MQIRFAGSESSRLTAFQSRISARAAKQCGSGNVGWRLRRDRTNHGLVRAWVSAASLLLLLSFSSCATIASDGSSALRIDSNVEGARVEVFDHEGASIYEGVTPCSLQVDHSRSFFLPAEYRVVVSCDGADPQETTVTTSIDEWYLANALVPGGLVGSLLVDPWTGAMYELDTQDVRLPLQVRR